jgi:hypothetical protein
MRFLINQTSEFTCVSVYPNAEDAITGLAEKKILTSRECLVLNVSGN